MALLNKTGITDGSTIQSEHVTRTIDALTGVSTDSIVATGSFSGTLTGTSSFATTASYALNATSTTDTFTVQMMHIKQSNTTSGSISWFGPFASDPFPSLGRIGVALPYTATIISASAFTHAGVPDAAGSLNYSFVWYNGSSYSSASIGDISLSGYTGAASATINQVVNPNRQMSIQMTELATSTATFVSTVILTLKKS